MKTEFQIGDKIVDISRFIEACTLIPNNLEEAMKEKLRKRNDENIQFMQRNLAKIETLLKEQGRR